MWPEKLMKGWLVPTINLLFCKDSIFHDCEMVIMPCAMINKTDLLGNLPECLWYCLRQCQHFPEQIFQPKISHFRTNIFDCRQKYLSQWKFQMYGDFVKGDLLVLNGEVVKQSSLGLLLHKSLSRYSKRPANRHNQSGSNLHCVKVWI